MAKGTGKQTRDDLLVAALAMGATQEAAADAAGVSRRTLVRRLEDPAFRRRLEQARAAIFERAADQAAGNARRALDTLDQLLSDWQPPAVRLGAARTILESAARLRETVTLAERVAAIEAAAGITRDSR